MCFDLSPKGGSFSRALRSDFYCLRSLPSVRGALPVAHLRQFVLARLSGSHRGLSVRWQIDRLPSTLLLASDYPCVLPEHANLPQCAFVWKPRPLETTRSVQIGLRRTGIQRRSAVCQRAGSRAVIPLPADSGLTRSKVVAAPRQILSNPPWPAIDDAVAHL